MKKITISLISLGAIGLLSASMFATACDKQAAPMHKMAATESAATPATAGQFIASVPYARAVPPSQPNSAVFMQLQNKDSKAHALVKASSPASEVVELHTHLNEGGVMKMRKVEKIDLPAGKTVALKPGGFHIMFFGLKKPLKAGESVDLTLTFEDGTTLATSAPVKEVSATLH